MLSDRMIPLALALLAVTAARADADAAVSAAGFPAWAYAWDPQFKPQPATDVPRRVPGSTATYSVAQARDLFFSPDWHPDSHPVMPAVVARGRKPSVRACGCCHRAEGTGGPENASLAGLSAAYIVQQMADFKSGARKYSGPPRAPVVLMIEAAKAATDAEVKAAAAYFSALQLEPNIRIIESKSVPRSYIAGNFHAPSNSRGTEPLGQRIIEMPVDVEQFELRDSRAQFRAYVPVGSVARGASLVKSGGAGNALPCAGCHGADLHGFGAAPGIAGRSPSYIVRQLYDYQHGARTGAGSAPMRPVVAKFTQSDMIAVAAYLGSLRGSKLQ
jgi:cytochrome c553